MGTNKTILLTGATDGIGKQTAKELAEKDYTLIIHGRDTKKVQDAVIELENINKSNEFYGFVADYTSLSDVNKFAEEVKKQFKKLDV
ncbi:MAG: SDR family NAD(P)-dependent oxidoreductase, partial [Flexistipes sinusarabici]